MGAINSLFVLGRSIGFIGKLWSHVCHIFGIFTIKGSKNALISFTVSVLYLSMVTTNEMNILVFWNMMLCHWVSGPWYFEECVAFILEGFIPWRINHLPSDATLHPRRLESCIALLWKPQTWTKELFNEFSLTVILRSNTNFSIFGLNRSKEHLTWKRTCSARKETHFIFGTLSP